MATAAQITANRANAQLSTGPASPEGKARSSQNNLHHGLRSASVLLPGDDSAGYDALVADLAAHFHPRGFTDERFVREMADAEWRLCRCRAHQQRLVTVRIDELAPLHPGADAITIQALAFEALYTETAFAQFLRYESKFERQYERAYNGWTTTAEKVSLHKARSLEAQIHAVMNAPIPGAPPRAPQSSTLPDEPNSTARAPRTAQSSTLPDEPNSAARAPRTAQSSTLPDEPNSAARAPRTAQNSTLPDEPNSAARAPRTAQTRVLPDEPNSAARAPRAAQTRTLPDEPNSVARNAPCPCGSGLKYKRCCGVSPDFGRAFVPRPLQTAAVSNTGAAVNRPNPNAAA